MSATREAYRLLKCASEQLLPAVKASRPPTCLLRFRRLLRWTFHPSNRPHPRASELLHLTGGKKARPSSHRQTPSTTPQTLPSNMTSHQTKNLTTLPYNSHRELRLLLRFNRCCAATNRLQTFHCLCLQRRNAVSSGIRHQQTCVFNLRPCPSKRKASRRQNQCLATNPM
jgi:hypothetical protein